MFQHPRQGSAYDVLPKGRSVRGLAATPRSSGGMTPMPLVRLLVCAGLLGVLAIAGWASCRARQRDLMFATAGLVVASLSLVWLMFHHPVDLSRTAAPATAVAAPPRL